MNEARSMKFKILVVITCLLVSISASAQRWMPQEVRTNWSGTKTVDEVFSLGTGDRFMVFDDPGTKGFQRIEGRLFSVSIRENEPESTAVVFLADGSVGYMSAKTVKFYQDLTTTGNDAAYATQLLRAMASDINALERFYERTKQAEINTVSSERKYKADGIEIHTLVSASGCFMNVFFDDLKYDSYKSFVKATMEIDKQRCDLVNVDISGIGGSVSSAMKIGILIRKNKWNTTFGGWTDKNNSNAEKCLSSCTLAFLGGVKRTRKNLDQFQYHQPARTDFAGRKLCIKGDDDKLNVALNGYIQTSLQDKENTVYRDMISISCTDLRSPSRNLETLIFNN